MIRDEWIPDLVSKAEAAEIIGVFPQAVQQMTADGRLRGALVGKTWVYRREAVEALAEQRRQDQDRGKGLPGA